MIRLIMFDVGDTLIRKNSQGSWETFPHVETALATLRDTKCGDGTILLTSSVSDFEPAANPQEVADKFAKFLGLLERVHLREYFQPVDKRVTLSTHVGVTKPDRRVFEMAPQRLGSKIPFSECLFVTENAVHIAACQALGMDTLQFGLPEGEGGFKDWSRAPDVISSRLSRPRG